MTGQMSLSGQRPAFILAALLTLVGGLRAQWSGEPELYETFTESTFVGLYYNNFTWSISRGPITGGTTASLDNLVLSSTCPGDTGHGFVSMTVTPQSGGGEMKTFRKKDYSFGKFEVRMKPSSVHGACHAFFWQSTSGEQEVDVEFATVNLDNGATGEVEFTLHPGTGVVYDQRHRKIMLDFNPTTAFHTYGWVWAADSLVYYIDGEVATSFYKAQGAPIPDEPGPIWLNAWTSGGAWLQGPPAANSTMVVDWVKYWPESTSGIEGNNAGTADVRLSTYPSPTTAGVRISVDGARDALRASVFDMHGRLVTELAGASELAWDRTDLHGRPVPAGLYCVRVTVDGRCHSRSLVIR